jgi:hypothetical protein
VKWRGIRELAVDFAGSNSVWEGYINKNFFDWKAAIAGKPAPTGVEYS